MTKPSAWDSPASAISHQRAGTCGKRGPEGERVGDERPRPAPRRPGASTMESRAGPRRFTSAAWAYQTAAAGEEHCHDDQWPQRHARCRRRLRNRDPLPSRTRHSRGQRGATMTRITTERKYSGRIIDLDVDTVKFPDGSDRPPRNDTASRCRGRGALSRPARCRRPAGPHAAPVPPRRRRIPLGNPGRPARTGRAPRGLRPARTARRRRA